MFTRREKTGDAERRGGSEAGGWRGGNATQGGGGGGQGWQGHGAAESSLKD